MTAIFEAIPKIMAECGAVGKNETNKQQGYRYRSADDVSDTVRALMGKHGVFPTKRILEHVEQERESKQGGRMLWVKIKCLWTFYAADGSSITHESFGEGMDSGDKATNKAETGSMKNALLQVFQLMGHEDSETDSPELEPEKEVPRPVCPACGSSKFVYEDKRKGGFFCWKKPEQGKHGCGHNWNPDAEPDTPPKANGRAKAVAEQHGLKTADELPPPSKNYQKALDSITAAVRNHDVEEVARILNVAEKALADGKLSEAEHKGITHECTLALRKIKAMQEEPLPA